MVKPTLNRDEPPKVAIQCNIFIDRPKGTSSNLAWTLPHCPHCFRPRLSRKKRHPTISNDQLRRVSSSLAGLAFALHLVHLGAATRLELLISSPRCKKSKSQRSSKVQHQSKNRAIPGIATPRCIAFTILYARLPPLENQLQSQKNRAVKDHAVQ